MLGSCKNPQKQKKACLMRNEFRENKLTFCAYKYQEAPHNCWLYLRVNYNGHKSLRKDRKNQQHNWNCTCQLNQGSLSFVNQLSRPTVTFGSRWHPATSTTTTTTATIGMRERSPCRSMIRRLRIVVKIRGRASWTASVVYISRSLKLHHSWVVCSRRDILQCYLQGAKIE